MRLNKSFSIGISALLLASCGATTEINRSEAQELVETTPIAAGQTVSIARDNLRCLETIGAIQHGITDFRIAPQAAGYIASTSYTMDRRHDVTFSGPVAFKDVSVTGVRDAGAGNSGESKAKVIEFDATYDFDEVTNNPNDPMATEIRGCLTALPDEKNRTAIARLYDDGWRVEYVSSRLERLLK